MTRPTKHIEQMSEKYGVPIWWAEGASRTINVGTASMVTFHRVSAEIGWDHDLAGAATVMVRDAA